jgi:hypothetical protein
VSVPDIVRDVARAVLYEGYLLWPYRRSALKNQQRWTIGGVYPRPRGGAHGAGPHLSQTQCLVAGDAEDRIEVRARFLQVVVRDVARLRGDRLERVPELTAGGRRHLSWEEATEREVVVEALPLAALAAAPRRIPVHVPAGRSVEWLYDDAPHTDEAPHTDDAPHADDAPHGDVAHGDDAPHGEDLAHADDAPHGDDVAHGDARRRAGAVVRRWRVLRGRIELAAEPVAAGVYRLTVRMVNTAAWRGQDRREALRHTFVSAHAVIHADRARLVSLTDPPGDLAGLANGCENIGTWPVLVGVEGERHTMLSAPVILPDYPRVAPESPGDLFDATEIDALLTLNILTLGDDERREMRDSDPRAAEILDRCAALTPAQLMRLHGRLREVDPRGSIAAPDAWQEALA